MPMDAIGCAEPLTTILTGERFPLVLEITSRERQPTSDLVLHAEITNEKPGHGMDP